ncbi:MAG: hypothetical protein JNM68_09270 [Dinghuibacter sp.]|nr:hypothetical protein [Dinghuibacter sp.]
MRQQPWIGKPVTDILFILLPPFGCLLFIALFPQLFQNNREMPDAAWVALVLLVDVAHVYSTLYRTYFDSNTFKRQRSVLVAVPFIGFVAGVLVYSVSAVLFWRLLAYVAVFHFVRQQYGFMRVYARKENEPRWLRLTDTITIYYVTLYPLLYWHLNGPRNFNWFTANDFLYLESKWLSQLFLVLYILVCAVFVIKEVVLFIQNKWINCPKLLVVSGTALSWYFGIVYFNGDMAFTLLNVVSHGIPYMALVWIYGRKNYTGKPAAGRFLRLVFSRKGLLVFILLLAVLAFVEEGLWDLLVWQEHRSLFGGIAPVSISHQWLSIIVPVLALPQVTHYILDGFIWRVRKDDFKWSG